MSFPLDPSQHLPSPARPSRPWSAARVRARRLIAGALAPALLVVLALALDTDSGADRGAAGLTREGAAVGAEFSAAYGKLPMRFEANRGQTDPSVRFLSRGPGYSLFLTPREAVLSLTRESAGGEPSDARTAVVRMGLVGADPRPELVGEGRQAGVTNYLRGKDPSRWQKGIPGFGAVRYQQVYPGVDMIFHGRQRRLEYDFAVAPGRDPSVIGLRFAGARRIELERGSGDLLLHTAAGTLRQHAPVAYQRIGSRRRAVSSRYVRRGAREVGFRVGAYDRSRPLVIDPVLVYSTYLSGTSGTVQNAAVTADQAGNAYLTGTTSAPNYPTTSGVRQPAKAGGPDEPDAVVTKLAPGGSSLVYSTYLGGAELDHGYDIAVDGTGRAFVTGLTISSDFPSTANAFSQTPGARYLSVLNATGSALDYSTFLPWGALSLVSGFISVAVDSTGKAYLSGATSSDALPVRAPGAASPYQATRAGGNDVYVAKLDPALSGDGSLVYATYLGGAGNDRAHAIALDATNNAYVSGSTTSTNFPTQNAFQPTLATSPSCGGCTDTFVSKLGPQGSMLAYSSYLGGGDNEAANFTTGPGLFTWVGNAIAADNSGNAYVASSTRSDDFPTKNAFQPARAPDRDVSSQCNPDVAPVCADAFVAKVNTGAVGAASLVYSSYLGGNADDGARGVDVDAAGGLYVAGWTGSPNFPVQDPIASAAVVERPVGVEPDRPRGDAFVARVRPEGGAMSFSTLFGGGGGDGATDLAVDATGAAYLAGNTFSADLPTQHAFQDANGARGNDQALQAFVAKLVPTDPQAPVVTRLSPGGAPKEGGTAVTITGRGFAGATAVSFGGAAAESFRVESDGQITAVPPARPVGPAAVVVAADGRASAPGNPIADLAVGEGSLTPAVQRARERGRVTAVGLADGRVLAVGGVSASGTISAGAELYDPATSRWATTESMGTSRCRPSLTLLRDGRVLAAGGGGSGCRVGSVRNTGSAIASTELYDPTSGTWSPAPPMANARVEHTATLLSDGRVLVAGGGAATAEIYNPASGTWSVTGALITARSWHSAVLLTGTACATAAPPSYCGKVLVAGGQPAGFVPLRSAELYDPSSGSWQATGDMFLGRGNFTAVQLPDGSVLAAGGCHAICTGSTPVTATRNAEVYLPAIGGWVDAAPMSVPRRDYGLAALEDGKVLIAGGGTYDARLASAEVYDPGSGPAAGRFVPVGPLARYREKPFAVALRDGRVLVGGDVIEAEATNDLYTPSRPRPALPDAPAPGPGPDPVPDPPPAGGGGSQSAVSVGDLTRPVVSGVRVADDVFSIGSLLPRLAGASRVGTTIRFTLSESARARLIFARVVPGRRVGRSCRRPTRALRRRAGCTRFVAVSPNVVIASARAGTNRVRFQGRLSRTRRLRPGRYRLTVTATDAAGNRSAPRTARFRLTATRRAR